MEEAIKEIEKKDGIRLTWNVWPTKDKKSELLIPITCIYTPKKDDVPILNYEPIFCGSCRSILNPSTVVDFNKKEWSCVFCQKINRLPMHYQNITEETLPEELLYENSTVEYVLNMENHFDPIYVFLIDTCTFDDERHSLMTEGIRIIYDGLPDNASISIITFGTNIELLDLDTNNVYVFSGKKAYEKNVSELISRGLLRGKEEVPGHGATKIFFKNKKENHEKFISFIKNLERDQFPVIDGKRPVRCTGAALSFAVSICESLFENTGLKIFLFTQGPCTFGPGCVVSDNLKEDIRSTSDILSGNATYTNSSFNFYASLAKKMGDLGYSIDILAATLYDIGLYEMKPIIDTTGGMVVMAQDFDRNIFTTSCRKLQNSNYGLNAKFKINCSPSIIFKGTFGQGCPIGSNCWRLNALYPTHTLGFIFESNTTEPGTGYVQIVTQYQREDRKMITRVTTFARLFDDPMSEKVTLGFDQEAACVLQTRVFTFTNKIENDNDMVRRLDRTLIKFVRRFSEYVKEDSRSVTLPSTMAYMPYFIYFLRRSILIQTETNTPDETIYHRILANREKVTETMTMIVPTLTAFHFQGYVMPAQMDSKSLQPDIILLLDTFHNVVIWKGETISQWIKEGLHEKPEYSYLKECIENSLQRAMELVESRLPTPQFIDTERYGSQERILLSRINPSTKNDVVITDDIDFDNFYRSLCQIVVE
ncbi:Protein transport protein SEC23 [Dictyocoela muelleri]|nr:Protein transport protein SEC23 [Dictyocoela muelleri]